MSPVTPSRPASVAQTQARFNRSTRTHWLHFAPHRARVQELILTGRPPARDGRFCALGAGNCNDLELARLLDAFAEVHLVDIDPAAPRAAAERQGVGGADGLTVHAPVDLTGIADLVSAWAGHVPGVDEVAAAVRQSAAAPAPNLGGPFDVVLSSCVLSQLVGYATDALGGKHPAYAGLVRAIRGRHLRLMLDLLAPGGTGLLVCDLVSSESVGTLPRVPEHELPGLLHKLARDGTFFSGLFPDALAAAFRDDPALAPRARDVRLLTPWLWRLGPLRSFLVYGLRFRRAEAGLVLV
jgi:hypothetical protein